MAVVTQAGIDLNPLRSSHFHFSQLQPSAMPPPPPSISPKPMKPFPIPQRVDDLINSSMKSNGLKAKPDTRAVLNSIDANTQRQPTNEIVEFKPTRLVSKPKQSLSFNTSIPHLPSAPDVFTPTTAASSLSNRQQDSFLTKSTLQSKRAGADLNSSVPSKRRREVLGDSENFLNTGRRYETEQDKWRSKWIKSFPNLVFHFELGAEEGIGKGLRSRATRLGARVDQFFSTKVTHLIVKTVASPTKLKTAKRTSVPLSPKNPFLDNTGTTDLAQKAEALGIKVWTIKKFQDILDRLIPVGANFGPSNSLSTLLEDEKLHGTRERDLTAPRPDYYYFKPGHKYLLIEDATGKHRTVMVKEYQPVVGKAAPEWPTLYDSFLRVSSHSETHVPINQIRERAYSLFVDRKPWKGEQPPGEFRRSTSLRSLPDTPKLPELTETLPYQNASGNSVVLTSNIASTSNAGHSPTFINGVPQLGANKGYAITQMSKRVQVLKGNAAKLTTSRGQGSISQQLHAATLEAVPHRRASTGTSMDPPGTKEQKNFMSQEQVVRMLQRVKAPVEDDTSYSIERRIENRARVEAGLRTKDQDTAPGYCENCKVKYTDLSVHIASKRHRRFAENPDNFADLDTLLDLLKRPLNPALVDYTAPGMACWINHDNMYDCPMCVPLEDVYCVEDVKSGCVGDQNEVTSEVDEIEDEGTDQSEDHSEEEHD